MSCSCRNYRRNPNLSGHSNGNPFITDSLSRTIDQDAIRMELKTDFKSVDLVSHLLTHLLTVSEDYITPKFQFDTHFCEVKAQLLKLDLRWTSTSSCGITSMKWSMTIAVNPNSVPKAIKLLLLKHSICDYDGPTKIQSQYPRSVGTQCANKIKSRYSLTKPVNVGIIILKGDSKYCEKFEDLLALRD